MFLPLSGTLGSLVLAYGSNDSDSSVEEGEIRDDEPVKSGACLCRVIDACVVKKQSTSEKGLHRLTKHSNRTLRYTERW